MHTFLTFLFSFICMNSIYIAVRTEVKIKFCIFKVANQTKQALSRAMKRAYKFPQSIQENNIISNFFKKSGGFFRNP